MRCTQKGVKNSAAHLIDHFISVFGLIDERILEMIDHPNPKKLNESKFVFEQSFKAMGFAPNSLKLMAHKNNILGSFTILFAYIRGFADTNVSPWNALKMTVKNLMWGLKAKK